MKLPSKDTPALRDEVLIAEAKGRVPEEARRLVTVFARGAELVRVAKLRTQRHRWSLRETSGRELAELMDDRVAVLDGRRITQRFRELELEARTAELRPIEVVLCQLGAVHTSQVPKAVQALGPRAAEPSDIPEPDLVAPGSAVSEAVAAAMASATHRLMTHDPQARLHDAEGVHQMRVSARRLRGHLRTFSSLVEPAWSQKMINELRWLARALGIVRDLDVLLGKLRDATDMGTQIAPLLAVLEERQPTARRSLERVLQSKRYIALLERLIQAANAPPLVDSASESCRSALPRFVGETWALLTNAVKDLNENLTDDGFHQVRIHAKRARYAAEAAAPCLGRRAGADALRFAQHAEEVQNVLGARQDSVVLRQTLLAEAANRSDDGRFNFAAGRLVERQDQSIAACDAKFREVWRALNRKKIRAWLNE